MACAPLAKSTNESATWDCRLQGPIPAEDVGLWRPIDQLPGCNPLWKTDVATKPTCESTAGPAMVGANVYFENLKYRMHIPMAMSSIHNTSDLEGLIPGLGNNGDSKLQAWGSDGVDHAEMTVGTWEEIEAAEVSESNSSSSVTNTSETVISVSGAVSAITTSGPNGNGIVAVARPIIRLKIASASMSTHLPLLLHLIQLRQVSLPVLLVRFANGEKEVLRS